MDTYLANMLPPWVPDAVAPLLALQAATAEQPTDAIHAAVVAPVATLEYLEDYVRDLYENPAILSLAPRLQKPRFENRDAFDDASPAPDGIIFKSTTSVTCKHAEQLLDLLPELETTGGNPRLPASTPLIVLAPPEEGLFDDYYSISDQIDIELALLSRFHIVFPIMGITDADPAETTSYALTEHVSPDQLAVSNEFVDRLHAARNASPPSFSSPAVNMIKDWYTDLITSHRDDPSVPLPLFQSGLITAAVRLADAYTRFEDQPTVRQSEAGYCVAILTAMIWDGGLTEQGEYDIDKIEAGLSSKQRVRGLDLKAVTRTICEEREDEGEQPFAPRDEIIDRAVGVGEDRESVEKNLQMLIGSGDLAEPRSQVYRVIE